MRMKPLSSRTLHLTAALLLGLGLTGCAEIVRDFVGEQVDGADGVVVPPDDTADPGQVIPDPDPADNDLRITSLDPMQGRTGGAELVTIAGEGYQDGMKVYFGSTLAAEVDVLSEYVVHVRTPAHAPGPVDLRIVRQDGAETVRLNAFKFKDAIRVDELNPTSGPREGGTAVTVRGEGFTKETRVLIDGRLLVDSRVVDGRTILGIAPPGSRAGAVDVLAFTDWTNATAHGAYRYAEAPRIDLIEPAIGSTTSTTLVTLIGPGLSKSARLAFGDVEANIVSVREDGVVARVAAQPAGVVDVSVVTADGETIAPGAFAFVDGGMTPALLTVWPLTGPESGGTMVAFGLSGVFGTPEVRFGGLPAPLVHFDGATLVVRAPAGEGETPMVVFADGATLTAASPFVYTRTASIANVAPSSGSTQGGELVTLKGEGFPVGASVLFGGVPAIIVDGSPVKLVVRTPVGSPGAVPVRVSGGDVDVTLPAGFTYTAPGGPVLFAVQPNTGGIAGGTLLRFYGSGFDAATEVKFANKVLPNIEVISPTELRARSIRADEPSTVDVRLTWAASPSHPAGEQLLGDAYTYFDPSSPYGGSWGPAIRGAMNITVLDLTTTEPVTAAFVILGSDPSTPYQGFTDDRGQIIFSGIGLEGPQMVTASKLDYTAYSVVEYDAENVTVHLIPFYPSTSSPGGGGGGGGEPLVTPTIEGRVLGLGKYIVPPPKPCSYMAQKGLVGVDGTASCAPCADAADCGDGYQCFDIAGEGPRCALSCQNDAQCPEGYACGAGVSGSAACIPDPGRRAAYCVTTNHALWEDPVPAPGQIILGGDTSKAWADANTYYKMNTRFGPLAVICLGGVVRDENDLAGSFVPLAMGVARSLDMKSGDVITGLDVMLDIPLRKDVPVRLDGAPLWYVDVFGAEVPTNVRFRVALDFGAEGYWTVRDETRAGVGDFLLDRQPENLGGKLDGVSYEFLAEVTGQQFEISGTQAHRVKILDTDTLFNLIDGSWKAQASGIEEDLFSVWGTGDDRLWAVGARGRIAHRKGGAWFPQFSPVTSTLRGVSGAGPNFALAVGDGGTIVAFDGTQWLVEPSGTTADLMATCGTGPYHSFAVGTGTALYRDETGWHPLPNTPPVAFRGAYCPAPTTLWAVGDDGLLWTFDRLTGVWSSESLTSGQGIALNAIAGRSASDVWIVGSLGTILHRTAPGQVTRHESGTVVTLHAIALAADGRAAAVGARGALLTWDGLGWARGTSETHAGDLRGVAFLDDPEVGAIAAGSQAVTLGPMLSFPRLHDPAVTSLTGGSFEYHVQWDTLPGALPTFNFIEITAFDFPVWWTVVEAQSQEVTYPNLMAIQGISPFISPSPLLTVRRILKPGVTVDNFDFWDTYDPWDWQSWAEDAVFISP